MDKKIERMAKLDPVHLKLVEEEQKKGYSPNAGFDGYITGNDDLEANPEFADQIEEMADSLFEEVNPEFHALLSKYNKVQEDDADEEPTKED